MALMPESSQQFTDEVQQALIATHRIERELGGGGMSRVFVAEEIALKRKVVVKVLAPELAAELSGERFTREIQLVASLQQANIIPVIHAGQVGLLPFYTMPFVDGLSLRATLLRDGPLAFGQTISVLRDVAKALAFAHARGVVHRDIKPDNVLLSGGTAVVADFGIAKAITAARTTTTTSDSGLTRVGTTVGTPAYMAPEQAAGDPDTDHRADLYAWGVMAYELLSGRHPFADKRTPQALIIAHLTIDPPPVSDALPDLPPAIANLVMLCLAKDPSARPADADALVRALDAAGEQLLAVAARPPRPVNSIAVLPFTNMSADAENEYFADGITEEILNGLAHVRGLHVVARTSSFQFKGQQLDLRTVGEKLQVRRVLEGSVRRAGSRVRITAQLVNVDDGFHVWSNKYDRELVDIFAVQDEIAMAIVTQLRASFDAGSAAVATPLKGTEIRIANTEAYELFLKGRVFQDQRVEGLTQARSCFERAVALDPAFAPAHAHLGTVHLYETLYNFRSPRDGFGDARRAAERALSLDPSSAQAYLVLAYVSLFHDFDLAAAIGQLDHADSLNPPTAASLVVRSTTEFSQGRMESAISFADAAVRLDPLALEPRINLCMILYFFKQYDRAIREADGSLERSVVQSEPLRFKGLSLIALGRVDEAIVVLERAVAMSYRSVWALTSLATALAKAGRDAEVRAIDAELRERAAAGWVPPLILAVMACMTGDFARGATELVRSMQERDFWLPCVYLDNELVQLFSRDPMIVGIWKQSGLPFPV